MPGVIVYRGGAGTGKTWNLVQCLKRELSTHEWRDFEAVLGLTFMHGARRRLDDKLREVCRQDKVNLKCQTIDSFIVSLVNKFRSYLHNECKISVNTDSDFQAPLPVFDDEIALPLEKIHEHAVTLLKNKSVIAYISNSYPIIVIDEFQDCTGLLLEFVKALKPTTMLIAIDDFQQLRPSHTSEADTWTQQSSFQVHNLTQIRRTRIPKLLIAAESLRSGVMQSGEKMFVKACPSPSMAASLLTNGIYFGLLGGPQTSIAVISPSLTPPFVVRTIAALSKPYKLRERPIGPYGHLVGQYNKTSIDQLVEKYQASAIPRADLEVLCSHSDFVCRRSGEVALKKVKLRHDDHITATEFISIIHQSSHLLENFIKREYRSRVILSTIHGAKNKEFDHVIILWPYQVPTDELYKRKLLYNAITRAKQNVSVLVQHSSPNNNDLRIKSTLFSLII
jgi:hypothetical protein